MKQAARASKANTPATGGKQNAAISTAISSSQNPDADAETLLKADHRKVEQLFAKFEGLEEAQEKSECAKEICKELVVHSMLEEEIFYPACREKEVKSDMLDEAQVEHDGAKVLICELLEQSAGEEFYDAKVKVLSEYIKHHVGEEEKGSEGIFALAKKAGVDMKAVGQKIQARKQELLQEMEGENPPPPEFKSLQTVEGQSNQEDNMARYDDDRDSSGRFRSGGGRGGSGGGNGGRGSSGRERDEYGRFMSDDDDDRRYSSRGGRGGGRDDDDDYDRRSSRSGGGSRGGRDDDDGRGWYGDSEGHSEASRRGWEGRRGDGGGSSRYEDETDRSYRSSRGGSSGRERDDYGRFTSDDDRDYGRRSSSRGRYEDEDDRNSRSSSSSRGGRRYGDDDNDGRGWYGDSEGHAEAARRGWESRDGGSGGRGRGRREDNDDDRRSSRGGRSSSQGHGGWFGDSRGHAEAARRGWRNRD